jgi:hypothetical protein
MGVAVAEKQDCAHLMILFWSPEIAHSCRSLVNPRNLRDKQRLVRNQWYRKCP